MNDYNNYNSVQQWLDKAYWPWPLALAYSIGSNRDAALQQCVAVLDGSAGVSPEYVGLTAVHLTYAHAIGDPSAPHIDWNRMQSIERPLVAAIEADKIAWRGRPAPGQPFGSPCDSSQWMGAEIHSGETSDLVTKGFRHFHDDLDIVLGNRTRTVWLYDIHLKGADVKSVIDGPPRMLDFIKHPDFEERLLIEEMLSRARSAGPSTDSHLCKGADGALTIVLHPSLEDVEQAEARAFQEARDVNEALSSGVLSCLVEAKDTGHLFKIPRHYWFLASGDLRYIENRDNVPPQFVGQPVQVELRHLESWKAALSPPPSSASLPRVERGADDNWTKRALTPRSIAVLNFFNICGERWHNGEKGNAKEFLGEYQAWVADKQLGRPYGKTDFDKWRRRWRQGYRVHERKLIYPS